MTPTACTELFKQVYEKVSRRKAPPVDLEFYPYADLDHTIRLRNGRLKVRLSDIVVDAPRKVIESLAYILISKMLRRKIDPQYEEIYRKYAESPDILAESAHTRAVRGRPSPGNGRGEYVDLRSVFNKVNAKYFAGKLRGVKLLWSKTRSMQRLGYYRETFHTIVISRALDNPLVPKYVIEYLLYHEMLHAAIPSVRLNGRRCDHTPEFRAAERRFEHFEAASEFLNKWPPRGLKSAARKAAGKPRQLRLF